MNRHAERRKYARLSLCAYGVGKVCIAMLGQERCHMDLVDISSGGARLKLNAPLPESAGKSLTVSVHGVKDEGRLQNLAAQIRWRSGLEIGVQFETKLGMGLSDLQRLIG